VVRSAAIRERSFEELTESSPRPPKMLIRSASVWSAALFADHRLTVQTVTVHCATDWYALMPGSLAHKSWIKLVTPGRALTSRPPVRRCAPWTGPGPMARNRMVSQSGRMLGYKWSLTLGGFLSRWASTGYMLTLSGDDNSKVVNLKRWCIDIFFITAIVSRECRHAALF